jgi:hypothetical protein
MKNPLFTLIVLLALVVTTAFAANYFTTVIVRGNLTVGNSGSAANLTLGTATNLVFGTNSKITVSGSRIAGIDSFVTTATVDTVAISGVGVGDIFVFAEYTPLYSAAVDTISFAYQTKTDTVLVYRRGPEGNSNVKSGALYSYLRLDK